MRYRYRIQIAKYIGLRQWNFRGPKSAIQYSSWKTIERSDDLGYAKAFANGQTRTGLDKARVVEGSKTIYES